MKWAALAGALIVAFVGFALVSQSSPEAQAKSRSRNAIGLCWDEYKRKSLTPAEQRFIAGSCERMERDFTAQYGSRP